jgi:ATP-dependent Clp protease ATP-binding subunit ClpA
LEPKAVGVVLLDEIEKAKRDVIYALYQVIDEGEWTNKRLGSRENAMTDVIPCNNLIFS